MQRDNTVVINNNVTIVGKIITELKFSHQIYGEGFYSFNLEAARLSDVSDALPITISDRIINKDLLTIGTHCKIVGQIRSYNNYMETEHKNRLILTVFVRDIKIKLDEEDAKQNPNEVILNGYICKPPIFRTTPFGREIADLLIAVNRSYNKSDYIPCIAWGRNARFASKLTIGENIRVWGRMQSRAYQKKKDDGETVEKTAYEVSISKVEYLNLEDLNANARNVEILEPGAAGEVSISDAQADLISQPENVNDEKVFSEEPGEINGFENIYGQTAERNESAAGI